MEGGNSTQNQILRNYDQRALGAGNVLQRQQRNTYEINSFNNWIKSVLINVYTSQMCRDVQKTLDLRRNTDSKLLHVLDIGCGRGQDIKKWKLSRVSYMVANDFSIECLKQYQQRWNQLNQPYKLYTTAQDFTNRDFYYKISHSYYDLVSAQFCFHYMFQTQKGLSNGLESILSNLLIGGVFIATIPDGYTILKKINQKGIKQSDGSTVYGNKYFSIKFKTTKFTKPFGNQYGFYLQEAVGSKNIQTGQIQYVNEWLISLDQLQKMLKVHGVVIQTTMNFLQFYLKYRQQYKDLFSKFKLTYDVGQQMDPQLWEIGHLYRVLVCRKQQKGKKMHEFTLLDRKQASKTQIKRAKPQRPNRFDNNNNNNNRNRQNQSNPQRNNYNPNHSRSRDNNNNRDYHHSSNKYGRRN